MKTILISLFLESLKAIIKKLSFAVVKERFLSRIICYGLRWLAESSTNKLTKEIAESLIDALKRPDLPEIK